MLEEVLDRLELSHAEFIDMCILCGCDYTDTLPGIGTVRALRLIKEHGRIETAVDEFFTKRGKPVNLDNFRFEEARKAFLTPEVADISPEALVPGKVQEAALMEWLVKEKDFNAETVKRSLERLSKSNTN